MRTMTLRQLIDTPGPFTLVHLDDSHDTEDAETQLEPESRDLRDELSAVHAPEGAADAARSGPVPVGPGARAVVASLDTVVVDDRRSEFGALVRHS